jgi:peptidoglycan hydrolase-like protein with peptidoglycan-binding domain
VAAGGQAGSRCADVFTFQVLLDRRGFSPGEIDGVSGRNLEHALRAFQRANGLSDSGKPDCQTLHALSGGEAQAGDVTTPYEITGVSWMPPFHYNPDLFWDADPKHTRATIKPGPNNPVGVVWIDISKPHYGIHGTPEPSRVGHTASHGCVRLTNWDAARVAALSWPGMPVTFK